MFTTASSETITLPKSAWRMAKDGWMFFRVLVRLIKEKDGSYSVYAPTLPGAGSQGDTIGDALANVREALIGALMSYRELKKTIPWVQLSTCPRGEIERSVLIEIKEAP